MLKNIKTTRMLWHIIPIIALGIWVVFCISHNMVYDEAYTAGLVSLSFGEIIEITAVDVHPPVYYFLARIFHLLCGGGTNYWSLKVFSLIFAMGYMLLGKYYVRKLYDESVSIYFMLVSILTPIMLTQVGNARMYTYALFFMMLSNLLAIDILKESTKKKWILFTICSIVTVYTHTYTMIQMVVLYLILFVLFLHKKEFAQLKAVCVSGVLVSIAYLPWLRVTYLQMDTRVSSTGGLAVRDFEAIKELAKGYKNEWFSILETPDYMSVRILLVILVMMSVFSVYVIYKKKEFTVLLGIIPMIITILLGTIMSVYISNGFLIRYVFSSLGAYALFIAVGITSIKPAFVRIALICSMLPFFVTHYQDELALEYTDGLVQYMDYVEEYVGESDAIIGPTEHAVFFSVYYPEIQHFIYGYKPDFLPFSNVDAFTDWSQMEEIENIWFLCFEDRDPSVFKDNYTYEQVLYFEHMNYIFKFYKLIPIE